MPQNEAYPYWKDEFEKEYYDNLKPSRRKRTLWFCPKGKEKSLTHHDTADSYRVFMIYCNNNWNSGKTRLQLVEDMKKATIDNPIVIEDEIFWSENN